MNEVETTSIYYSNTGNLIVPIVTYVLGEKMGVIWMCGYVRSACIYLDSL